MSRRIVVVATGLLAALATAGPAQGAITITPGPNTVETPHLSLDFGGAGDTLGGPPITVADPERLDALRWTGSAGGALGSNLVAQSLGHRVAACGGDIQENWGMSYGYEDGSPPAPVAAGTAGTFTPLGTRTVQMDTDRANACSGQASLPVRTRYSFFDAGPYADMIRIERTWTFGPASPDFATSALRAYVPRLPLGTYGSVMLPTTSNTLSKTPASPTASDPAGGTWRADWVAQSNSGGTAGLVLLRDPADDQPAKPASDYDSFSNANNTGIALVKPVGGWKAPVTEVEYLCLFDAGSWPTASATTLPAGCAARPVPIPLTGGSLSGGGTAGAPLQVEPGTWENASSFGYQWQRCAAGGCTPIDGATGAAYTPTDADAGATLQVVVTGTNANGESDAITVVAPAPVAAGPPKPPTPTRPAAKVLPTSITQVVRGLPSAKACVSRRNFRIRLAAPAGVTITKAVVQVNGRQVAVRRGARITAPVDLRGLPKNRYTVKITVTFAGGKTLSGTRKYRTCAKRRTSGKALG